MKDEIRWAAWMAELAQKSKTETSFKFIGNSLSKKLKKELRKSREMMSLEFSWVTKLQLATFVYFYMFTLIPFRAELKSNAKREWPHLEI